MVELSDLLRFLFGKDLSQRECQAGSFVLSADPHCSHICMEREGVSSWAHLCVTAALECLVRLVKSTLNPLKQVSKYLVG